MATKSSAARQKSTVEKPETALAQVFKQHGYVRAQDADRRKAEGWSNYKKGHEVRLVVTTKKELADLRRQLKQAGFMPGKPYVKHSRIVQPIYGKEAVERFQRLARSR